MSGFKNLIARRRPSNSRDIVDSSTTEPALQSREALPEAPVAEDKDIARARAGRDRVPGPEAVRPRPVRPTLSDRPRDDDAEPVAAAKPKIWELEPGDAPMPESETTGSILARCSQSPLSAEPRRSGNAGTRAKTRLLGFHDDAAQADPLSATPSAASAMTRFPIGWIVVTDGPGRGASFALTAGLSTVGRDSDQTVALDYGDDAISREGHVSIAYDEEENRTYVGHGGKSNIVRLNDNPLLSTEELRHGDCLRIGKTVLRFMAFCTPDFAWRSADEGQND